MSKSPLEGKRIIMVGAVLVVDLTIEVELRRVGARTVAACQSAEDSVEIIQRENPDLVLIGVTPTNLNEALVAVGKIASDPAAYIAAIVYHLDIEAEWKLRDAGVTAIFKKPFTAVDLIPALEETFRQHRR